MESFAGRHLQLSPTKLSKSIGSPQDIASLHQMFKQYCAWLETPSAALGEDNFPMGSPLNFAKDSAWSSAVANPDILFAVGSKEDYDALSTFDPSSLAAPSSTDPSSHTTSSDRDEAMLDLPFDEFLADTNENFSGFLLPEFLELDNISPKSNIADVQMQWNVQNQACIDPSTCCFVLANKTLKSLHLPSTACLSSMGKVSFPSRSRPSAPRTAGSVLTRNKEAMLVLSRMLNCACSSKPQLQLVIATICDKLVTWYRAMVQGEQSQGSTASTTKYQLREGVSSRRMVEERVSRQPVSIGDYNLDGAAEAQITARVVFECLQELDSLVAALSKRIKDVSLDFSSHGGDQYSSSFSDEGDILGMIRDRLVTYLSAQLQTARQEAGRLISENPFR